MSIYGAKIGVDNYCCDRQTNCPDKFGCPPGICPDFVIKRHDTKPSFKILIEDCDGAIDLTDENLILEANIWSKAKLKTSITASDDYFALADNIGFEQIMVGDIIVFDRVRLPEHMLVLGFDEANSLVQVQRAYHGTVASAWKKGTPMRIFRNMNASAQIETVLRDVVKEDGTVLEDQISETYLVYNWDIKDTCTPGCYWIEFKLLKMLEEDVGVQTLATPSNISFTPSTMSATDFGCFLGAGVEWVRRFPVDGEGFLVKIANSPTMEI